MFTTITCVPKRLGDFDRPMHVCLTITSLAKNTGGPATVVEHLSEHLAQMGMNVTVMTHGAGINRIELKPKHPQVEVVHVSSGTQLFDSLKKNLMDRLNSEKFDLVHNFGIWMPMNHAVSAACKESALPLMISPCGMLAPWALRYKAWKKKLAWWLYQRRDLDYASVLVATAKQEMLDIQRQIPGKTIALVPNGVNLPEWVKVSEPSNIKVGREKLIRKAVFLGRIHPVKGLKNLVEAWGRVRPDGWQCILAGPDEAGHKSELVALLRTLGLEQDFVFPGLLEDGQKWNLLREADLFLLPSFTENFSVAVVEALAAGVPVITTKGTPWEELTLHHCGWWVDVGIESLVQALHEAMSLSDNQRHEMGNRGRQLARAKYAWPHVAKQMQATYEWVLGKGPIPDCVASK